MTNKFENMIGDICNFGRKEISENCGGGCASTPTSGQVTADPGLDNSPTKHAKWMYHPQNTPHNQNHIADTSKTEPIIAVCPHCGEGVKDKTLSAGKAQTHFPGPAREYPEEFWKPETYYEGYSWKKIGMGRWVSDDGVYEISELPEPTDEGRYMLSNRETNRYKGTGTKKSLAKAANQLSMMEGTLKEKTLNELEKFNEPKKTPEQIEKQYVENKIDMIRLEKKDARQEMDFEMESEMEVDVEVDVESMIHNIKLKADMLY